MSDYENCAIEEFPTESGPADYALCVGGQILGVVEAKKLTLGPQEVLPQADRYSRGLAASPFDFNGFRVPFLYSTNGEIIWHHDVRHPLNRSHQIASFHAPEALREFLGRDFEAATDALLARPNGHPRLRPYQREANAAIEQAIAGRPLTPLHGGHVGLLAVSGLLNGIFGDGPALHIVRWQSVKEKVTKYIQCSRRTPAISDHPPLSSPVWAGV